ncbi:MAG: hypothetical protein Q8O52_06250 [Sulfuritalea sp.]|nr:hypothetical protein [Sulfuritalea sp.]
MGQPPRKRRRQAPLDANLLRPAPVDLFGEVPITRREVMLWMWKVPAWMTCGARPYRIESYIRNWDVAGKIRRAKLYGGLEDVFGDEACPHCGVRLEMDYEARITALTSERQQLDAVPSVAVDARPMAEVNHQDDQFTIQNPAKNAVVADTITPQPGQITAQRFTHAARITRADDAINEVGLYPFPNVSIKCFSGLPGILGKANLPDHPSTSSML